MAMKTLKAMIVQEQLTKISQVLCNTKLPYPYWLNQTINKAGCVVIFSIALKSDANVYDFVSEAVYRNENKTRKLTILKILFW